MKSYYLTPGPSELYFTVPDHIRTALQDQVCAISHRSKAFQQIMAETVTAIRQLLQVPDSHHIVFTGSANEIWERILENLVDTDSFHLVNGSFSKRFYEFAVMLRKRAHLHEVPFGQGFDVADLAVPAAAEIICATQNETSSGVAMPLTDLYSLKDRYPDKLLVVDAVSSVPFPAFDFGRIDSLFFSVQKGMGLPAGLGVWIFNEACVAKAKDLQKAGKNIGTYHSIPSLLSQSAKNQTPETPNMLGIYLLGKVCQDMNSRGIEQIRQETVFKATLAYQLTERLPRLSPLVRRAEHRSQTVIVADVLEGYRADDVLNLLKPHGLIIGKGYGDHKETQIRIANFPTHSKELFYQLEDVLNGWK